MGRTSWQLNFGSVALVIGLLLFASPAGASKSLGFGTRRCRDEKISSFGLTSASISLPSPIQSRRQEVMTRLRGGALTTTTSDVADLGSPGTASFSPLSTLASLIPFHNHHSLSSVLTSVITPILLCVLMWSILSIDIVAAIRNRSTCKPSKHQISDTTLSVVETMSNELKRHRQQKLVSLRETCTPLALLLGFSCIYTRSVPWQPNAEMWRHGPTMFGFLLNIAYWTCEIVMDTTLDECGELKLYSSASVSGIIQLISIAVLTTTLPHGHILFWLKAAETLLATFLAKLVDHLYWIGIAGAASCFVGSMAFAGRLVPLPTGVPLRAAVAYFGATLFGSTAYQLLQNHPAALNAIGVQQIMGNVKLVRATLCALSMCLFQTPASWVMYDVANFAIFFGIKVITDTVAIEALNQRRRQQRTKA